MSAALDENDGELGRAPYVLEVTSPGVDRPLTEARHWRRNVGRLVAVPVGAPGGAEPVTGRVTAVDDAGVTLAVEGRSVESKGKPGAKKRPPAPRHVPWAELGAGRVQVEFGRAGADTDTGTDTGTDTDGDAVEADDDGGEQ